MSLADEIIYGTLDKVITLLDAGEDVNALDVYGFTPLIETAIMQRPEIAEELLKRHADVNRADATGRTALHWAVDNADMPLVKLLLKHGANPNAYTRAGEPVLVNPLLRRQTTLKKLLISQGAKLSFAQDFINTKLLGHRYELQGEVDIVNGENKFIEIEFEGFFLEFTLNVIRDSLLRYKNNFSARHMRQQFSFINEAINALDVAAKLMLFHHHVHDLPKFQKEIFALLDQELLIFPVCYAGHAITFIKYHNTLVKCDRGENGRKEGTVILYHMPRPELLTKDLIVNLIYKRQKRNFIHGGINTMLNLEPIAILPLEPQVTGNCSWANVEAAVPAIFLLLLQHFGHNSLKEDMKMALLFFCDWLEWDKDRALDEIIHDFKDASAPRQASKATSLAAVLYQGCQFGVAKDFERAGKIIKILMEPGFEQVIKSYMQVFLQKPISARGKNFQELLKYFDVIR